MSYHNRNSSAEVKDQKKIFRPEEQKKRIQTSVREATTYKVNETPVVQKPEQLNLFEEKLLKRCLDSYRPVCDEIVIVDTGSTDRTKEIAAGYTDLIYDYPWNNDFAAARNFLLSVSGSPYVFVND